MRKRRKTRYTWMPALGGTVNSGESAKGNTGFGFLQTIANDATAFNSTVISLVPDETFLPDQANTNQVSLRDFTEGQDWLLKRIVGKCVVGVERTRQVVTETTSWANVTCCAAFFVARAQDDNQELPDLTIDEYDPLESQNVRQPWIWRRTWVLSDGGVADNTRTNLLPAFFSDNIQYTNAMDGPHIDAKTARRIRREERLWFVFSAVPFTHAADDGGAVSASTMRLSVNVDYRILGTLRKSNNRSTF